MPTSTNSFSVTVTFWNRVPDRSPPRWTMANASTTPTARIGTDPPPARITMYSAMTTALAAPEKPRAMTSSPHPATKPAAWPHAARA